ncbi:electron carrier/ protein disulfide oxidoreductase [Anaeramoeba flamelloides]|uniref:Electron carrier/ protein disulfide oxidoreductase n=1 Tax=Anaeramoeba flamelloides TaxID=1746091 RepID=A0AAV7Z3W4_9EUKA|nr:electron carrier/ protein disulfide oxidoreductase [Anaeramoeba flamelloides]
MSLKKKQRAMSFLPRILKRNKDKKKHPKVQKSPKRRSSSVYANVEQRAIARLDFVQCHLEELKVRKERLFKSHTQRSPKLHEKLRTTQERVSAEELETQKLKLELVFLQNSIQELLTKQENEKKQGNEVEVGVEVVEEEEEEKQKENNSKTENEAEVEKQKEKQLKTGTKTETETEIGTETKKAKKIVVRQEKVNRVEYLERSIEKLKKSDQKEKLQEWFVVEKTKFKEQTCVTNNLLNNLSQLKSALENVNQENKKYLEKMTNSKEGKEKMMIQNRLFERFNEEYQNIKRKKQKIQFDIKNMRAIKTDFVKVMTRSKEIKAKMKLEMRESQKIEFKINKLKELLDLNEKNLSSSDFDTSPLIFDSSDSDNNSGIPSNINNNNVSNNERGNNSISQSEITNNMLSENKKISKINNSNLNQDEKANKNNPLNEKVNENENENENTNNNAFKRTKITKTNRISSRSMGNIRKRNRSKSITLTNSNFRRNNMNGFRQKNNYNKRSPTKKNGSIGSSSLTNLRHAFGNFSKEEIIGGLTNKKFNSIDDSVIDLKKKKNSLSIYNYDEEDTQIELTSLEMLLRIPTAVSYFTEFLRQQMNLENILFFQAAKKFKRNCHTKKQIKKTANKIAKIYIYPESFFEINIISETRKNIIKNIEEQKYFKNMFDKAQLAVYNHMNLNSWSAFQDNKLYGNLIKNLNKSSNKINLKQKKCTLVKNQNKTIQKARSLNEETNYQLSSRDPLVVVENVLIQLFDLINIYYCVSSQQINFKLISQSIPFQRFVQLTAELQNIKLQELITDQYKLPFFLNLYNCLTFHSLIVSGIPKDKVSADKFMKNSVYTIQGLRFSLNDIYYGILRANHDQKHLNPYFIKGDPRKKFTISELDPRIHFAIMNFYFPTHLRVYTKKNLNHLLKKVTVETLSPIVAIQSKFIFLPKLFGFFEKDFGGAHLLMDWISKHLNNKKTFKKNHYYSVKFLHKTISKPKFIFDTKSTLLRKFSKIS